MGKSKVLQEVLADLKITHGSQVQTLLASFLFLICSRAARSIALAQYRLKAWRITFLGNSSNAMTYFGSSLARMPIEHEPNRELICNLI